ncbi:hypothetical protein CLV52_2495 [Amnibacterium kyonggiense]|uniref:Uncharacterized protein n=1 Tax=Amnibacterium kyonggiense TaxID=595671 RepID=A0A4R7FM92_9MICO|nr:hypothetical protein CLV52_2495 [Amnibacterium kyonggiense]
MVGVVFLQVGRGGRVSWALLAAVRRFLAEM